MQLNVTGHHVDVTSPLKDYVGKNSTALSGTQTRLLTFIASLPSRSCATRPRPPCC